MLAVLLAGLIAAQPAVEEPPAPNWFVSAEYVYWWLRRGYAPPILTTGPPGSRGILGQPGTSVVYGDERLQTRHQDQFIGTRFAVEWLPASSPVGVEGRAFFLERDSTYFTLKQRSDRLLALSYFDAAANREASLIVAGPDPERGLLWGGFVGYSRIELFGEEVNAVVPLAREEGWALDLLAGARFLQMRDRYHHTASNWVLPEKQVLWGLHDRYGIHNAFYGGQLGLRGECQVERFFIQARAALALGADAQLVRTWGERVHHTPQERVVTKHGLFVQPGNTGHYRNCNFDGVGEVAVNAGYQIFGWLRGYVGYTFLYWADPMRAAEQVDRVVNQPRPAIPFKGDAFWAQGWNVGLEARW
jgi:hypothetical protein